MKHYYVVKSDLQTGSQEVLNNEYFETEGEAATLMVNAIIAQAKNDNRYNDILQKSYQEVSNSGDFETVDEAFILMFKEMIRKAKENNNRYHYTVSETECIH